jgi:DNA-binding CsgD family transcriptional regulator/catechol 2,3-dioxygenase-like lactoylglutathione lyase family enzyme
MSVRSRRGRPPHADLLTPTEWRTVHALQHGMTNREIARRRGVSTDAVKYHVANALAKLGLTDRQALRRWFREPAGSALSKRSRTMSTSKLGPLAQISRSVRDIQESQAWYADTLGLPHLYTYGTLAFFDCGGTRLYLQQEAEPKPESILYLRVEDIRAAYDTLRARGVVFDSAPHMIHRHSDGTEEWLATFRDPEGRPLMIMAQAKA